MWIKPGPARHEHPAQPAIQPAFSAKVSTAQPSPLPRPSRSDGVSRLRCALGKPRDAAQHRPGTGTLA